MRVRVVVEEWPVLRLRYGAGIVEEWSETDINHRNLTPGLSAEVTRRTLFGRAVALGGAAAYQPRERRARAFVTSPTLFGAPIRSSLTIERSREDFASVTLVTDRSRIAWEQRMSFTPRLQLSYSYSFDRDHTIETDPDPHFPAFDVAIHIARLNGAAAFDTRNDPTDTTRGSLVSASLEYAPETLGSDIRFAKFVGQAYHFRPWKGVVLASAVRVGAVRALGDQELIASELFFAGGARSVRGVDEDGLGPRSIFDEPAGGGGLLVLNQEIRFPVYRWLRGVGFVDAGNVFARPSELRLGGLEGSTGAGARIVTPFGTLRVDYGRRWSGGAGKWTFGIGQTF
jgi:outer membrane protein insertion porin family